MLIYEKWQSKIISIKLLTSCQCKYHLNTRETDDMENSWKKLWKGHKMSWNVILKIVWEP